MHLKFLPSFVNAPFNQALDTLLDPLGVRPDGPSMSPRDGTPRLTVPVAAPPRRAVLSSPPPRTFEQIEDRKVADLWGSLDKARPTRITALLGDPSLPADHADNQGTVAGLARKQVADTMFTHLLLKIAQLSNAQEQAHKLRSYLHALPDADRRADVLMDSLEALLSAPGRLPRGEVSEEVYQRFVDRAKDGAIQVAMIVLQGANGFDALSPSQKLHLRNRLLEVSPTESHRSRINEHLTVRADASDDF
jgi:hypothetical protein